MESATVIDRRYSQHPPFLAKARSLPYVPPMPRTRDPDEPKIYFLPNLMTACNLACGFFAVLMIFNGMIEASKIEGLSDKQYYEKIKPFYQYAILLIFGSCLFDLLFEFLFFLGNVSAATG